MKSTPNTLIVWISAVAATVSVLIVVLTTATLDYGSPLTPLIEIFSVLGNVSYILLAFALLPLISKIFRGEGSASETRTAWVAPLVATGVLVAVCIPGIILLSLNSPVAF
ncbi:MULTISPECIES: hypothetical protein [unclassified Rothia (in: high G+C Gram-positive bacteria)]|uniref:hypothetical protein n=1 Tax=unclassified Rothia (in: high G+C Gram-positive bacteria) TaxID=2689056 RepID=UPI001957F722|nr:MULTISPECIES: hypothetical protein [unclassified Rothia (in: high G+C Gram-positive bacteria)]MBM7051836.1 hypothetical protein [Rothia sp. ZJ1223]QRZ61549.1 hypothetical protein JR346_10135 [Rothia sp. ZJ932]